MRTPLVYALHSGNLYGTERMALATIEGLRDDFEATVFAPAGPALEEAARLGFETISFTSPLDFAWKLRPFFARNKQMAFVATGVVHSLACIGWNKIYRRAVAHLHIVHGGADELLSYGRKRKLNGTSAVFVAVSYFVKERLIANGVNPVQINVIENFLPDARVNSLLKRPRFETSAKRLLVISRVDPIKRIDLLLDALDRRPELNSIPIRVLGTGWDLDALRQRAAKTNPSVTFAGFTSDVGSELAASDLLVHLCPEEPFGLAILEAMAAGIPVLVPDSGGAGSLVEDEVSGFRFKSNSVDSLAGRLTELVRTPAETLNRVVEAGRTKLSERFSARARTEDYRRLLETGLQ
jgi:glycosyltransferase involved in cell wall biosynthesis